MIIAQAGQVAQTMNADVKMMEITPTQALTIVELLSTSHILFVLVLYLVCGVALEMYHFA